MAFDFKKAYPKWYLPKAQPALVDISAMRFVAVRGQGDPNAPDGTYQRAMGKLYDVAYTLKMSARAGHAIEGFFDYVVPPLEGLWLNDALDYSHKENFRWISMLRLPDFITRADFEWAREAAAKKKKTGYSDVEWFEYAERLCVQCLHVGRYDDEPATLDRLHSYMEASGCVRATDDGRFHHEIYLSDPRRTTPDKLKTVLRIPVRKR